MKKQVETKEIKMPTTNQLEQELHREKYKFNY